MTLISYVKSPSLRSQEHLGPAAATATSPSYSLTLVNQSANEWTFYVYQQMPNQQSANVFSVAWFCSPFRIMKGSSITFRWSIDYTFVYGATGVIVPGVIFWASQTMPANPQSANTTFFSMTPSPHLSPAVAGPPQGSLVINDSSNVSNNIFAVGSGMGDAGTFITAAGPNLVHTFTPASTYWIAAGTNVSVGTILDVATVTQNLQVIFPVNVYEVACVLGTDNQWTQSP